MTSRRQFIRSGLAFSAVSPFRLWAAPAASRAPKAAPLQLERFVFDDRFAEAGELAQQVARYGVPLSETSGDLTNLWYDELENRWGRAPRALAGVTTRYGLFVLETLAADRGMRVVYRGEHSVPQGGRVAHVLSGPADLIARVAPASGVHLWESQLGRAMTLCPVGTPTAAEITLTTAATRASARQEALFSWIIAPRSSVALTV